MNFIDRLEKRYPNFGVSNLMIYVIAISGLGMLISMVNPYIYYQYLSLDFYQIFHHGQVWRLITFLLCPSAGGSGSSGLFWFVIMAWVYYSIGSNLERIWGRFRFTLFYLSGIVMILVVTLAAYLIMGIVYPAQEVGIWLGMQVTLEYVTESLFLAFALVFPDVQFLLFFIIPVKAKWLSIFYFALDAYQIIQGIMMKSYYPVALIVVSLINIFIFFFFLKKHPCTPLFLFICILSCDCKCFLVICFYICRSFQGNNTVIHPKSRSFPFFADRTFNHIHSSYHLFLLSLGNKKHTQIIFIGHSPFRVFPRCVQMIQNVRQVA